MDMNNDMEWKRDYSIGIEEIDLQHRYFLSLIKRLNYFLKMGITADYYKRLLRELSHYALFHFCSEENLMIHTNYPDTPSHCQMHRDLIEILNQQVNEIGNLEDNSAHLLHFLKEWFIHHTTREDTKIAEYLKSSGRIKYVPPSPSSGSLCNTGDHEAVLPASSSTIMIVEDTPVNLILLEKILMDQGYRVRSFHDGAAALKSAAEDPPDLIFLDIHMPGIDGYAVCRQLKSVERTKDVPVIFISVLTETQDKIKAFQAGGVDYITKPFQFEEVNARAGAHLKVAAAHRELEEKNEALKCAMDDLKIAQQQIVQSEKMAALGVLTAGIAHEINNPVNFIKASAIGLNADMQDLKKLLELYGSCRYRCGTDAWQERIDAVKHEIEYETLMKEIPDLLNNIEEGVHRTEEIVNSLRAYSRMEHPDVEKTDVHKLIDASLVVLKPRYKHEIVIEKKYGQIPDLYAQPGKLIQVFTNVVSNAIDAVQSRTSKNNHTITIKTFLQQKQDISHVVIEISDTGTGIPEDIRNKIFDPFYSSKSVGKGVGLGLSITQGIVQEHQGRIEVSSKTGEGATFSVFFPVTQPPML